MGCGGSTPQAGQANVRKLSIFGGNPVVVEAGKKVTMRRDPGPVLIVVFGGPGSRKGKILSDLSQIFGFEILNAESILLEGLKEELEPEEPKTFASVYKMIKANPELVRLDRCLKRVTKILDEADKSKCYLLDLIPNKKILLSSNLFIKDCNNEFKYFETKYSFSCALHLAMPVDKVMKKYLKQCAMKQDIEAKTTTGKEADPNKAQPTGGQSDEVSFVRTKTRASNFDNAIKGFVEYFKSSERLVYVDIHDKELDDILSNLCNFFADHSYSVLGNSRTLMLFNFSKHDVDVDGVLMGATIGVETLNMDEFCTMDQKPEEAMSTLCREMEVINQTNPGSTAFIINTSGSPITKTCHNVAPEKEVMFKDSVDAEVTCFLPLSISHNKATLNVQAVVFSTHVLLFSRDVPIGLCRWILMQLKHNRKN
ncbi:uncharacterized protein LOC132548353 [Ylistrum balloti]|uniref:uncharacterized protein LOC132548353 n=1 Tax=Ylistrum balloti TaxID=509963 RepID=UPI0029059EAA|nr:uncharacterized protein LOC132548353 [Ylistrum balloti]